MSYQKQAGVLSIFSEEKEGLFFVDSVGDGDEGDWLLVAGGGRSIFGFGVSYHCLLMRGFSRSLCRSNSLSLAVILSVCVLFYFLMCVMWK